MQFSTQPVLYLVGPTATGKTDLACQLADKFPIDIISVDSALIYRGMDIGTAKPDKQTLQRYPHALIDICDPLENYSVAHFLKDCKAQIQLSHAKQRIPLCVGGTMMYYNALTFGLAQLPEANENIREALHAEAEIHGWAGLHQLLQQVDPVSAAKIHPNDPQRLQRALEVYRLTGRPMSKLLKEGQQQALTYPVTAIALIPLERGLLHHRIEARFDAMLSLGFIEEVQSLRKLPAIHEALPSMRSVGYRQAWDYLEGNIDFNTMKMRAIAATRQLAKRQMTWLRHWKVPMSVVDPFQSDYAQSVEKIFSSVIAAS